MERIGFRIDEKYKLRWKVAALLSGTTLTEYIINLVEPEVDRVLLGRPMNEVARAFADAQESDDQE